MPHRSIRLFLLLAICMVTNGCRRESISEPKRHYVIGFSQCTNDLWRQIMMIQMQAEAAKYPELSIVVSNAHNNTQLQIDQIREFIEAKVDLLIISPNESEPVTPIAVEAFDMGIPTIIWDRKIHSDHYTTCISADNYDIGRDVGRYINTLLPEGSTILEITGLMSSSPAVERHKGFLAEASESYSVHTISGDWKPEVAKERIEAIGQYRNIDLIFAHNDDMALAAYDAINEADSLSAQRIKFIGIDALVGVDAVLDGRLQASFLYPTGGDKVMAIARRILLGKRVEKSYQLQSALVDSHNAYTLKAQQEQIVSYQEQINKQKTVLEQYDRSVDNLKYSLWAVIIIALVAGGMGIYAIRLNLRLRRRNEILTAKNAEIEIATRELMDKHAQIENVTAHKLQFFTNITHEIRTPLTLILNPLDSIVKREKDPEIQRNIWTIQRNARHLLNVVNQILDFRKIENNKMMLTLKQVDIVQFTQEILSYFETYAETEKIVYKFRTDTPHQQLWIDTDKIEQVLLNLLSNAFKYTPNGKMITIFIREDENTVSIGVQDQGIGIAENKKKSLFVRFENLVDKNLFNQASTGIGLSLVKELVEMHKATISVDSRLGEGSCFKVDFLKGKEHYDEEVEFILDDAEAPVRMGQVVDIANASLQSETLVTAAGPEFEKSSSEEEPLAEDTSKELMLLVEDNQELREFLRSIFTPVYRVVEAADGMEGWSKALKYLPDIIISDVMMPEKDGIEMTRELRADMMTSHIPIILLTAKTTIESKLEGLEYGADDYITKPFSATYLQARVENLLIQRKKLQSFYRDSLMHINMAAVPEDLPISAEGESREENRTEPEQEVQPTVPDMSPNDRKFMDKLVELMEQNMDNGELVVDDLVRELAVSRSVFFKKLKTLTGLAPIEFIKEIRIKRATQLIETGEFNMTQISYMVGINDPRYFSKCFKAQVGMTPTEYKEKVGR